MSVFLLSFHAYRSWDEDTPRGYVQRGMEGVQPPSAALARWRAGRAKHPAVRFDASQRELLIESTREIAARRSWTIYAMCATPTHMHLILGWRDRQELDRAIHTLKRLLGLALSRHAGTTGNRWFSRGCDRKRVRDREHFDHLVTTYIPKHVNESGVVWINDAIR